MITTKELCENVVKRLNEKYDVGLELEQGAYDELWLVKREKDGSVNREPMGASYNHCKDEELMLEFLVGIEAGLNYLSAKGE